MVHLDKPEDPVVVEQVTEDFNLEVLELLIKEDLEEMGLEEILFVPEAVAEELLTLEMLV